MYAHTRLFIFKVVIIDVEGLVAFASSTAIMCILNSRYRIYSMNRHGARFLKVPVTNRGPDKHVFKCFFADYTVIKDMVLGQSFHESGCLYFANIFSMQGHF